MKRAWAGRVYPTPNGGMCEASIISERWIAIVNCWMSAGASTATGYSGMGRTYSAMRNAKIRFYLNEVAKQ